MTSIQTQRLAISGCLLLFFWLGIDAALQKSPTADEPVHLARGVALWQGEDARLQQEHTPLSHWLIGGPVVTEAELPRVSELPGWAAGDRLAVAQALVWDSGLDVTRLFLLGRLPILWLAVLAGGLAVAWAGRQGGRPAALATAILFATSPNLIAHAALATTDFAAVAGYLAALAGAWWLSRRPGWRAALLAGAGLGLGLVAKMTGALLVPLVVAVVVVGLVERNRKREDFNGESQRPSEKKGVKKGESQLPPVPSASFAQPSFFSGIISWPVLGLLLLVFTTAGGIVWAAYRFAFGPLFVPFLGVEVPLPAPAYWQSLIGVNDHIGSGHRAFFLGEIRSEGWWSYFVVTFAVKSRVVMLLLLPAAAWLTARRRAWRRDLALWLPPLALLAVASASRLNIGYRHILPAVPPLLVWLGVNGSRWPVWRRVAALPGLQGLPAALLAAAAVLPALAVHPHHLAFFNLFAGGPPNGYRLLGDSNLAWGQDWSTAGRYVREIDLGEVYILPFGFVDPAYYGLNGPSLLDEEGFPAGWFSPANPPAGTYLLSANGVQGMLAEPDLLDFFRRRRPVDRRATGYSILVHKVQAQATGTWVAHCLDPTPLLTPAEAEAVVGRQGLRHVNFDCRSSWVFPENGGSGWLIVPLGGKPWWPQGHFDTALAEVYAHRATAAAPAYEVLYWDGSADPAAVVDLPAASKGGAGPANLLGGRVDGNTWRTVWQVEAGDGRPLSVFGHLYQQGDTPAGVADGLGFTADQWQPGDIFIQDHPFKEGGGPAELETGLYDFTTGERLTPVYRLAP